MAVAMRLEGVRAALAEAVDGPVPGIAVCAIQRGRDMYPLEAGVADRGAPARVASDTLFQGGSLAKLFTATCALRLVERGVLDLDGDVNRCLRGWTLRSRDGWVPAVSIRQLLSHTGGVNLKKFAGYHRRSPLPTTLEILDGSPPCNTDPIAVTTVPGTETRYSGGGYVVLQAVLEAVTSMPFEDLVAAEVCAPLGLASTFFCRDLPPGETNRAASGHRLSGGQVDGGWQLHPETAAAGLTTTATDLATLASAISVHPHRPPLLTDETAALMLRRVAPGNTGFGVYLVGVGPSLRWEHSGRPEGFSAQVMLDPEEGRGAVVLTNADAGVRWIASIMRAIRSDNAWPAAISVRMAAQLPVPGTFRGQGMSFELTHDDGVWEAWFPDQPSIPLTATAGSLRAQALRVAFEAVCDGRGEVVALVVHGDDDAWVARRVGV